MGPFFRPGIDPLPANQAPPSEGEGGNILTAADEFRLTGADSQGDIHRSARDTSINPLNPWCDACFVGPSKEFGFGGDLGLELIAEVFNLLDEENPARPNRFGVPTTFAGDPGRGEQRLGQLGLRVRF